MLLNELYLLYENNKNLIGKKNDDGTILLPIAHNTKKADIEVVIDTNGNFLRAMCVDDDEKIIIPVTEQSAGRTISPDPHPLCDEIQYLAGDYEKYVKISLSAFDNYYNLLKSWNDSEYSHEKVSAIFKYIAKKTLLNDLVSKAKLLETDEDNKIKLSKDKNGNKTTKTKLNGKDIEVKKIFIRFVIEPSIENKPCETWKDSTLYGKWIKFYLAKKSNDEEKDLCYISGKNILISKNHPKINGNAKLIAANDNRGFTYRGRFSNSEEALSVSYEISQKAHNALKWLLERQKIKIGDNSLLLCWESYLNKLPNIIEENTVDIFGNIQEINDYPSTQKEFSDRLQKAISGYKTNLDMASKILLLILETATSGRISVRMFREFQSSSFLDNIEYWHKTASWNLTFYKNKEVKNFICTPALKKITEIIYGREQNNNISVDGNILKSTIERLLPCVIDRKHIPVDIIKQAINKVSNPMAYANKNNWKILVEISCALIKKYINDCKNKEVYTMALDESIKDRSYLYGRLLAVADRIEYRTYDKQIDSSRQTNAKRYMSMFYRRPYTTWKIIYDKIQPYMNKLNVAERIKYQKLMNEIHDLFDIKDFENNSVLNGTYILGFECQSKNFCKKEDKEENVNE